MKYEERESPVINGVKGPIDKYLNSNGNGSLMKYVNGSGNGAASAAAAAGVVEDVVKRKVEEKKTVEEIGQEDAWFKQGGKDQLEVG